MSLERGDAPTAFFDLDGCLVDSRTAIAACFNHALASLSLPPRPPEDLYRYIGPRLHEVFTQLLLEADRDPALAGAAVDAYREVYPELSERHTRSVPGIPELLDACAGHLRLVVVTSQPVSFATSVLDAARLQSRFAAVFGPGLRDVAETKVVTLQRALHRVRLGPDGRAGSWMVGDRHHDIEAGNACGITTVGVTWGIGDRPELERAHASHIVDTPRQLSELLLGR